MIGALLLTFLLLLGTYADAANKTFRIRSDGDVRFDVPLDGPTRISVESDRITKIIQSHSNFEMTNDESTGDVFLRFVGSDTEAESGYIITEAGHTIGFTMKPRPGLDKQTVIIKVIGASPKPSEDTKSESGADSDFAFSVGGGGQGGRSTTLVEFAREAFNSRIGLKTPKRGVQYSFERADMRARLFSADASAGLPQHQTFYSGPRTLAVLVDDVVSSGRVWVVVVESRK